VHSSNSDSPLKRFLRTLLAVRPAAGEPCKVLHLPRPAPDYGGALERSAQKLLERQAAVDREREEADGLVRGLLARPPERQTALLGAEPRFHTWGVLEKLLEISRERLLTDSRESERLAGLALAQSEHLDTGYYGLTRIADMRARAWTAQAEALRMRSELAASEAAFAAARCHLLAGTGDSLEWAVLFEREAGLRLCQRQPGAARELLRKAIEIFVENGEDQRVGGALVSLAATHRDEGEPLRALPLLQEALHRIDRELEPRQLLLAQHTLADCQAAAGRFMEARGTLIRARPLYRRQTDPWTQSHLRWLRGRIAFGFDQGAEAEAELLGARAGFLVLEARFEAALAALDLAALYARQERAADLKAVAAEAAEAFAACGTVCETPEVRTARAFQRQAEEIEGAYQELARAAGAFGE
jgi:tetratricopeptide (TPR) repeat protein